ncbi:MAG: non-homologous end-joining DNA ligase [Actinobacteria bacterium]|nr:non-homologous end-joining DNA ligase [Actinomycetota bacterium]
MKLSSPDKVLWPEPVITKRELAEYYAAAADRMLPHLKDRPLTLLRANAGIDNERFLQKNLPPSAPAEVRRFEVWTETSSRTVAYALADDSDDLAYFANQNAVELHPWFSRIDMPDRADAVAFDLDPSDGRVSLAGAALMVRDVLGELGLQSVVKTSGKRGLHLYVPVERRYEFGTLRGFALAVGRMTAARAPDDLTVEMRKADRGDRLLLDWSRAGRAQTLAAAWSPRAHPAGTVSMPLSWDEALSSSFEPRRITIDNVFRRLGQVTDPWAELPTGEVALRDALRQL